MKTGRITAKLRDAVPVCFILEGKEVKRYKNIDLPDELKELEVKDFTFNVPMDGKITFHLIFDKGILPEVFPPERAKMTREEKRKAKEAAAAANAVPADPKGATPAIPAKGEPKGDKPTDAPTPAANSAKPIGQGKGYGQG